ncbi:hypothetical protein Tco_1026387, partial [Tanacetum coccineum]
MLPAFVAWLPRLSLSSSVIPIRNPDVIPRSPMLCPLLFLAWSRVVACLVVVHVPWGCTEQRISCSLRPCAGSSIYTVTSVLTQRELDLFCSTYNISAELPDRNSNIKNNPEGKISMYTRFIEFANYRILCPNASVCPLSLPWFDGTSVVKDPLPMDEFVEMDVRPTLLHGDNEETGLLNFVKTTDPFKVKTGERTLAENEVPLFTETEDRVIAPSSQPMSLADHTIQDELNVNSGKRKKRVAFASGSLPMKKARTEGIVISDARQSTAGKSPSALQRLSRQNEQASTGSGSAAPVTEDVISSSATPTPNFGHEDASHDNVIPPVTLDSAGATVPMAASTGGDHPASGSGPKAGTLFATPSQGSSADDFYESQTSDSAAAQNIYVPNWNVINNDRLASPVTCQNFLDYVTPLAYWAALRNQYYDMFLDALNVNSAQHVCMVSELRLRYEHEIMIREKFEKKFTESVVVVQQRDAEIVDLNVRLEKSEAETAKVAELRRRVSDLEATVAVKVGELANLRTESVSLSKRVSALELERDGLKDQVVGEGKMREEFLSQQDAAEQ